MHKICKMHNQKCTDTNNVSLALLQISSTTMGMELPSAATLSCNNQTTRDSLPQIKGGSTNINNDDAQYKAHKPCEDTFVKDNDTWKDSFSFSVGSTLAMNMKTGDHGCMESLKRLTTMTTEGDPT